MILFGQIFLILSFVLVMGCSAQPKKMAQKTDDVKPLSTSLSEEQEFDLALDVARLNIKNRKYNDAYRLLSKLKKNSPNNIKVLRLFTDYYEKQKKYKMAYISCIKIINLDEATPLDQQKYARLALYTEHFAQANEIYQGWLDEAIEPSQKVVALNNLGFSAFLEKKIQIAKQYFKKALVIDALNEKARNNLFLIETIEKKGEKSGKEKK